MAGIVERLKARTRDDLEWTHQYCTPGVLAEPGYFLDHYNARNAFFEDEEYLPIYDLCHHDPSARPVAFLVWQDLQLLCRRKKGNPVEELLNARVGLSEKEKKRIADQAVGWLRPRRSSGKTPESSDSGCSERSL